LKFFTEVIDNDSLLDVYNIEKAIIDALEEDKSLSILKAQVFELNKNIFEILKENICLTK